MKTLFDYLKISVQESEEGIPFVVLSSEEYHELEDNELSMVTE